MNMDLQTRLRRRIGTCPALLTLLAALAATVAAAAGPTDRAPLVLGPGGRFEVTADWRNPYGEGAAGHGRPHPISMQSGTFWFFHPDNLEVLVKLLDGRQVNDRFWLFYTSLSSVEFILTVDDRERGWQRFYRNPPFAASTRLDTAAFGGEVPPGDVVWVGAHPDDELILSPLLGELCDASVRSCTLIVATRGEAGSCRLAGGCSPDLGAVRERELRAAAELLGAEAVSWRLPDVPGPDPAAVRAAWADAAGGADRLVASLTDELRRRRPAAVLTFDPRHGSTCHPAHRVVADLVLQAVAALESPRPRVLLLETAVSGPPFLFGPAAVRDHRLLGWDASRPLAAGGTAWDHLLALAAVYDSQFAATHLESLAAVPAAERRVHLAAAGEPPTATLSCASHP